MVSYLGSLVQFSPAAGRAGRCGQTSLCVGSTHRVPATLGLSPLTAVCAFPVYTAQAPGCSTGSGPCTARGSSPPVFHKSADLVAPAFCAFPGPSSSGSQELDGRPLPGCGAPSPLHGPSLSFRPRQSGACALCLAATLPADVDHPESHEVFGYKLEACLQFGRGCRLRGRVCPCPLPPASCLWRGWAGPLPASSSLELLSPFVLRMGPQCVRAG